MSSNIGLTVLNNGAACIGAIRNAGVTGLSFAGRHLWTGMEMVGNSLGKGLSLAGAVAQRNPRVASMVSVVAIAALVLGTLDLGKKIQSGAGKVKDQCSSLKGRYQSDAAFKNKVKIAAARAAASAAVIALVFIAEAYYSRSLNSLYNKTW